MPKKMILAVDDEPDLLDIVRTWLKPQYDVITAPDGEQGLRFANTLHPDLVILDISMPKMGGFEVLSALRGYKSARELPVIMLTAQGQTRNIYERNVSKSRIF